MAVAASESRGENRWMMWGFWAAGVTLLLLELNAGIEYFQAGLQHNMGNLLGWGPAMGMITLKLAMQSLWHWEALELALRGLPLAALGLLLVLFGLVIPRQSSAARERRMDG